ncbi:MAG: hypothetical protein JOY71_07550 [Acetobacteraceae bacterium]|nr:hypothetical protein [Acetobacteraceae bacterium]MBV8521965.1 hypothetical protein [Acetobacteraceae bacterium]MBV8591459.1 hypothetical protein [Acetobacteraceae bacterium]
MSTSVGFASTIKPYFTDCYHQHMLTAPTPIDLWDPKAVQQKFPLIKAKVESGDMPASGCPEGVWDPKKQNQFLSDFEAWKNAGYPP